MRNIEIYIENTRLELFNDETIQITDSIQDVKDIKKVFTAFSQTFKVPASDNNNKLFKHYYNADIDGYDGRFRKDAIIKIDGVDFKKGRMRLNSVDLVKGIPTTYNITFFGNTVQLTELLGEDNLNDLERNMDGSTNSVLQSYNFTYNPTYVKDGLTTGYNSSSLIFPFISSKNYYYADSGGGNYSIELPDGAESRNIHDEATSTYKGVYYKDLKPALKVSKVIDAIEEKYGFTFSNDFMSTSAFTELYMWLHREKGQITEQLANVQQTYNISDFPPTGSPQYTSDSIYAQTGVNHTDFNWVVVVTVTPTNASDVYDLDVPESTGDGPYTNLTGTQTKTFRFFNQPQGTYTPTITVSSDGSLGDHTVSLELEKYQWYVVGMDDADWELYETYYYSPISVVLSETTIASQMPKIKVIDFLTSLFKMFNLTTYFDGSQLIVKTLDDYYSTGNTYDITKYIDTSTSNVAKSNIYRNVAFKYPEPRTFAVYKSNLFTGEEFGNDNFEDRDIDGGVYNVEVKFEKFMYERMTDQDNDQDTVVQWGWFVDDNKNEYVSNPLLFYAYRQSNSSLTQPMVFDSGGSLSNVNRYYKPMNVKQDQSQTLHFNSEFDEYNKQVNSNSLFNNYYSTYINNVFDKKARIYKFTAHLPSQILNRYELNDVFIIAGREYRINKIKTNLLNGKTELELINKL